jgi:O-antigen/teichoic acid export membrane protein
LYQLWTRRVIDFDPALYFLVVCSVSLKNFGAPIINYLTGINDLKAQLSIAVLQTAAVTFLAVSLLVRWKLVGVGIALLGGEIIGSCLLPLIFFVRQLKRSGERPPVRLIASSLLGTLIVIAVSLPAAAQAISPVHASVLGVLTLSACLPLQWLALPADLRAKALNSVRRLRVSTWCQP